MTTNYTPDRWVVVKITPNDRTTKPHYRVFATWYGGWGGSDSWKINSGIVKAEKVEEGGWRFWGSSGSVYHCHPNGWGTSGYGEGVLQNLIKNSKLTTIEKLENQDWLEVDYDD